MAAGGQVPAVGLPITIYSIEMKAEGPSDGRVPGSASGLSAEAGRDQLVRQPLHEFHGLIRLGPYCVVRIGLRVADDSVSIHHEARRHRKSPAVVAVVRRDVDPELLVHLAKLVRERERQAVGIGGSVPGVAEHFELPSPLFPELSAVPR